MKKIILFPLLILACAGISYYAYYTLSEKEIVENEIVNFKFKKIQLKKSQTDFLDANYIDCGTNIIDDPTPSDTVWNNEELDFRTIMGKWKAHFKNNNLDSVKTFEKVGVNNLQNIEKKNLYKLIVNTQKIKNQLFTNGFIIIQTITYKSNDTLKVFSSEKRYSWKIYKWERTLNNEILNSYYKTN